MDSTLAYTLKVFINGLLFMNNFFEDMYPRSFVVNDRTPVQQKN